MLESIESCSSTDITTETCLTFTDVVPSDGRYVYFKVKAVDVAGVASAWSNVGKKRVDPPLAPQNVGVE
jgi:hypothetical protein